MSVLLNVAPKLRESASLRSRNIRQVSLGFLSLLQRSGISQLLSPPSFFQLPFDQSSLPMGQLNSCLKLYVKPLRSSRGPEQSDIVSTDDTQQPILPPQNRGIIVRNVSEVSQKSFDPRMEPSPVEISNQDLASYVPPSLSKHVDYKKPARVILPIVPTEVLLIITNFLPPSNILSLAYSCRAIRQKLSISAPQIFDGSNACQANSPVEWIDIGRFRFSTFTGKRDVGNSERLELLCLLDRDRMLPSFKAICSGCAATHDRSLFSTHALAQTNRERICRGLTGRIWICPHWIFDHNLVMTSRDPKGRYRCGKYMCGGLGVSVSITEKNFRVLWPIVSLPGLNKLPPKKIVGDVMSSLDFPVCEHIRSSDDFVKSFYSPDCRNLRGGAFDEARHTPCQCSSCALLPPPPTREQWAHAINYSRLDQLCDDYMGGRCHTCRSLFNFSASWETNRSHLLLFVVRREIVDFRGCTDPAWIKQMTDPAEFDRLEKAWNLATAEDADYARYTSPAALEPDTIRTRPRFRLTKRKCIY